MTLTSYGSPATASPSPSIAAHHTRPHRDLTMRIVSWRMELHRRPESRFGQIEILIPSIRAGSVVSLRLGSQPCRDLHSKFLIGWLRQLHSWPYQLFVRITLISIGKHLPLIIEDYRTGLGENYGASGAQVSPISPTPYEWLPTRRVNIT